MQDLLQLANVLVIPAFAYIIVLERRITQLQAQLDALLRSIERDVYPAIVAARV